MSGHNTDILNGGTEFADRLNIAYGRMKRVQDWLQGVQVVQVLDVQVGSSRMGSGLHVST